jgi:LysM repeat protein
MGKHVRKRKSPWWAKLIIALGFLAAGLTVFTIVITSVKAASSSVSRPPEPLPVFTSDPSYPGAQPSPQPAPSAVHVVISGDTLAEIAVKYCRTADWMSVAALNHIGNPGAITIGEKITC